MSFWEPSVFIKGSLAVGASVCAALRCDGVILMRCMFRRNADTLKRLQEAEKKLKEAQTKAYISMDISNQEREQGNKVTPLYHWASSTVVGSFLGRAARGHQQGKPQADKQRFGQCPPHQPARMCGRPGGARSAD